MDSRLARAKITAIGACLVLLGAATLWARSRAVEPGTAQSQDAPSSAEAGKTFDTVCASCHGLDGRGGERGPDLVSRVEISGKSDANLREIIEKGKPSEGMPSFANYGTERLDALVGYLRTLQGRGRLVRLPGNPMTGKALFFGKAKCSECHMANGQGGFFGQDLSRYGARRDAAEIRSAIVNPDKDFDPRRGIAAVKMNDKREITGLVRNEDNFSLQLQTQDGRFNLLNKAEIEKISYAGRSGMPLNYGTALSLAELNDLVSFLLRSAGSEAENLDKDSDDDFEE